MGKVRSMQRSSPFLRYGVAVLAVALVILIKLLVNPSSRTSPRCYGQSTYRGGLTFSATIGGTVREVRFERVHREGAVIP
jgi:hypothetical protein